MFDALLRVDKALEEEEQKLRPQQTAGGAPPADGGAK
jgi:hypothetical protein